MDSTDATVEGSPIDALIYFVLMSAALIVLVKRKVSFFQFLARNGWLCIYLLYGLISIIWSDFPLASFKRWNKSAVGNIMMCLIILSEHDPVEAIKAVVRRCAYILLPTSILLIKYFPQLGRSFTKWGEAMNTGVTYNKNILGYLCLILGFVLFWQFMNLWQQRFTPKGDKRAMFINGILLTMITYLFMKAHSMTSFGSFLIGACMLIILGLPSLKRNINHLGRYVFLGLLLLLSLILIGPSSLVSTSVEITGHEDTFWGRVELWKNIISLRTNPLIGAGYESFWNSKLAGKLWELHWWKPTEAHNGYLETYINLGGIGLFFLIALLMSSFRKIQRSLVSDFDFGRLRLGFLIIAIFYNVTEAAFKGLSPVWLMLLLVTIDPPQHVITTPIVERRTQNPYAMMGKR